MAMERDFVQDILPDSIKERAIEVVDCFVNDENSRELDRFQQMLLVYWQARRDERAERLNDGN
jgi:hypothetical protein